ncbi:MULTISPECIES: ROK family transcriptional regulator [Streptomyces]|uniref:ROK family transcriptional regulator n=1 Tax=Streptomyces silvisoli TaxID=3034235 RepID=A0ABT5ZDG2_9ACTN|nr:MULTISPECIES: ROK family transcriptional regulator [Streptomyces]MDF3287721.1 ROK family transcriptional regulator [Streptomyces silvisoli]
MKHGWAAAAQSGRAASQQGMRRQNLALVMTTVAAHGPMSRAAVAERTGLTRAAVSSLVDELHSAGLLTESGSVPSGRAGRPGRALALSERGPAGLGLEVGVGHLGACVVDLRGEVRVWLRVAAANRNRRAEEVLAELTAVSERAVGEARASGLRPVAAVLAVPGLVGDAPGTVERAPNLGWRDVAASELCAHGLPLEVDNEANLGALAELWQGAGACDFIHVSAAEGIGAALVVGGRVFRGARGFAGELGHVPVRPDGPVCACGARGCLEQYAGEEAVLRQAGLGRGEDAVRRLASRARDGDRRALGALERAGEALGTTLAGAVNLVDPAAVVLGGAYAELGDWLLPGMRRELATRTLRRWPPEALLVSALGRRGPLTGAGMAAIRRIIEDPAVWRPTD